MEPTHFIASETLRGQSVHKTSPGEVETFYDQHGLEWIATISRWKARLSQSLRQRKGQSGQTGIFAPVPRQG